MTGDAEPTLDKNAQIQQQDGHLCHVHGELVESLTNEEELARLEVSSPYGSKRLGICSHSVGLEDFSEDYCRRTFRVIRLCGTVRFAMCWPKP
jgi:hypothetical protein